MPEITFNAFSFLQKKLKAKNIEYSNVTMTIAPGSCAQDVIHQVQLTLEDVEVVFINGKVAPFDTIIQNNDRVALVPPMVHRDHTEFYWALKTKTCRLIILLHHMKIIFSILLFNNITIYCIFFNFQKRKNAL